MTPERAVAIRCYGPFCTHFYPGILPMPPDFLPLSCKVLQENVVELTATPLCWIMLYITSAHKDRKALDGGKIWTRETDDAVISAWMTEFYDRGLPQYRAVGLNEQKSSQHDSGIHTDDIPEHRAAGKTLQFYPCAHTFFAPERCHPLVDMLSIFRWRDSAVHRLIPQFLFPFSWAVRHACVSPWVLLSLLSLSLYTPSSLFYHVHPAFPGFFLEGDNPSAESLMLHP